MTIAPLHVAIIGAGPGGLCLAQGLQQHGIAVQVYEKDAVPEQRQGYRLRIDHNGQAALARCLPPALYEHFQRSCALPASCGVRTLDAQLVPLQGKWVNNWRDNGRADLTPDLRADRQAMREVLLRGLEGQIHFGKGLSRYEERAEQGVILHFDDGSTAQADILVGADGIHSCVRTQRFVTATPTDTGDVCCYGKTALDATARSIIAAELQSGTSVVFERELALIVDAMLFDPDQPERIDDYLYWALIGRRSSFGVAAGDPLRWPEERLRTHIAGLTTTWPVQLRALLELAAPGAITLLPIRAAPELTPWPSSRITLLGDAIHAMSPASGLGANSALFDAAALAQTRGEAPSGRLSPQDRIGQY